MKDSRPCRTATHPIKPVKDSKVSKAFQGTEDCDGGRPHGEGASTSDVAFLMWWLRGGLGEWRLGHREDCLVELVAAPPAAVRGRFVMGVPAPTAGLNRKVSAGANRLARASDWASARSPLRDTGTKV